MSAVIQDQDLPLERPQPVLSSVARMRTENSFIESDIRVTPKGGLRRSPLRLSAAPRPKKPSPSPRVCLSVPP
jgi:hypothetical protein